MIIRASSLNSNIAQYTTLPSRMLALESGLHLSTERQVSGAPGSRSEGRAKAGGRRLPTLVRQDVLPRMPLAKVLRPCLKFCRVGTQILSHL